MKIDFENDSIAGCIPVSHMANAPIDQSPCVIEKCIMCDQDMWVSEKKRNMRKHQNIKIFCFICIVQQQIKNGIHPNDIDLVNINNIQ